VSRRALLAGLAATVALTAVLAAWYAAAGQAGLVDAAAVAVVGVLVAARGTVPGQEPRPVRIRKWRRRERSSAVSAAEFPGYRKIAADLSWGLVDRRHFEHGVRRTLARLAAALGRPDPLAGESATGSGPPDADGPGADLAMLDRIVTRLEEDQ